MHPVHFGLVCRGSESFVGALQGRPMRSVVRRLDIDLRKRQWCEASCRRPEALLLKHFRYVLEDERQGSFVKQTRIDALTNAWTERLGEEDRAGFSGLEVEGTCVQAPSQAAPASAAVAPSQPPTMAARPL